MKQRILTAIILALSLACAGARLSAQTTGEQPLTNEEFLRLVRQLPRQPSLKEEIIKEVRRRGISFPLTNGLRSIVATKSGNDVDLRRTLEEAERRRLDPKSAALPSAAEADAVLARARAETLEAAQAMPDFVVKQLIRRSQSLNETRNWRTSDRLVVGVSYRARGGEQYRVLAVNGIPTAPDAQESGTYAQVGGMTSSGEFVSLLLMIFGKREQAKFKLADTDTLRGRRTLVYEYEVKSENSNYRLRVHGGREIVTAYRGRVWIDRENFRVLRAESVAVQIPADFPIQSAVTTIDYDWVGIAGQQYLLPSRSVAILTSPARDYTVAERNDILFRNYQKFGTELKVIDEDIIEDEPPQ
ncbi:MAG TPA: hypothetical protein VFX96_17145 [Pyrinomonadaceae bacterium]|nr:hypothetical protein [Pyrinomonadaceae bacterium]